MKTTSLEQSLGISKMCQDILSLDCKIHFSCYINRNGRMAESKFCNDGLITGLTGQELEMRYMQCKLQSSMNKEFEERIGRLDYTLICRKSSLEVIFPYYDGIFFIITDKEIEIQRVCKRIIEFINVVGFDAEVSSLR